MRILLFIGSLQTGGAERQFNLIAEGLAKRGHRIKVCVLFPGGRFWETLSISSAVNVISLYDKRPKAKIKILICLLLSPFRLARHLKNTDLVYSALSLTDFIAWLATRMNRDVPLVWGFRSSRIPDQWKLRLPFELCRLVSRTISLIIVNSVNGKAYLESANFRPQRFAIIQNGIDTSYFKFDQKGRSKIRAQWGVHDSNVVIGLVGRISPEKNYEVFLNAAKRVLDHYPDVVFVSVGGGPDKYRSELVRLAETLGLDGKIIWCGERRDLPDIYSALDIFCSASSTEGFPNVIAEAMSCGLRCVATNVGDTSEIISDEAWLAPPNDPEALGERLIEALDSGINREITGMHFSIESRFGIGRMIENTERELASVLPAK